MDPFTVATTVITIAGAVYKSYEEISKIVALVRNAPKRLEGVHSRAESINSIVLNLKQALEETTTRKAVEKDGLALKHTRALEGTLKAVESTLDKVVGKLTRDYKPKSDGKHLKRRWRYCWRDCMSASTWKELQARLSSHVHDLGTSMHGLNTCVSSSHSYPLGLLQRS